MKPNYSKLGMCQGQYYFTLAYQIPIWNWRSWTCVTFKSMPHIRVCNNWKRSLLKLNLNYYRMRPSWGKEIKIMKCSFLFFYIGIIGLYGLYVRKFGGLESSFQSHKWMQKGITLHRFVCKICYVITWMNIHMHICLIFPYKLLWTALTLFKLIIYGQNLTNMLPTSGMVYNWSISNSTH